MVDELDFPTLLKRQSEASPSPKQNRTMDSILLSPPVEINGTLDPYAGPWTQETARHLLKRSMFAPNAAQIAQAVTDGLDLTLQKLFAPGTDPGFPINYNEQND